MTRTYGAKDIKKRKVRKDRKHKYVKRKGKLIPYKSRRQRGQPIKVWAWKIRKMNPESYKKFSRDTRLYMRRTVYVPTLRFDVPPEAICNKENVEATMLEYLWDGNWLIMGFSNSRNRFGVKPVKLCTINISQHPEGLRCRMMENHRLFRYWFWQK